MASQRTAPGRNGEVRFKAETDDGEAIATPSTYWAASPKKIKAWDVHPENLKKFSEDDPHMEPKVFRDPAKLLLGKGGNMPFKSFLCGLNQTGADAAAVTEDDFGTLLKATLGGQSLNTSTLIASGNTGKGGVIPLKVDSAAGIAEGSAVLIGGEARRVIYVNTGATPDEITLDMDLSSAPTAGTLVRASATYYLDESALVDLSDSGHSTFAFLFRGWDSEDQYQLRGGFAELELDNLGPNKIPYCAWTIHAMDWELVSGVAVSTTPTERTPPAQINAGIYMEAAGTQTRTLRHTKSLSVRLGLKVEPQESPTGQQGIYGHLVMPGRTALEFDTFYDSEWNVGYEAGTEYYGGYQIGTQVLLSFPRLFIDETPERGGQGATSIRVKMHADNGTSTTNELTESRFAIHRFPS